MKFFQILFIGLCFSFVSRVSGQFTLDMTDATETYVTGINNSDNFCGYFRNTLGETTGFFRIGDETFTLRIQDQNTWLGGINSSNLIVGRYNPSGSNDDFHVFIYDPETSQRTDIADLDGYEFTDPHDINDNGQISGDVKTGVNRRFFIWDPNTGLNTQNYLIGGSPAPTYGGYSIDNSGRITGFYIDGANYYSFRYHPDFGYTDFVDLEDPEVPNVHKTRLMGANGSGKAVLDFILSDNCHVYDFNNPMAWSGLEKFIPGSIEIHGLDINDSNHMVGYYLDQEGVVHGFVDFAVGSDYDLSEDGHSFANSYEDMWDYDWENFQSLYQYDPYWSYYGYYYPFPQILPGYLFPPQSYPSWSAFVQVMSLQSCYYNVNFQGVVFDTPILRPSAFNSWKISRTDNFEGACFGMAANSGASWQYPELLNSKMNAYNQSPFLEDIYNLGSSDVLLSAAHQGMAAQASQTYTFLNASANTTLPHEILNELMAIFLSDAEMPIIAFNLNISAGLFGHAVFPYAIVPQGLNEYKLFYYDPNEPGSTTPAFDIRYDENLSYYTTIFGTETTSENTYGMRTMPVQEIYEPVLMPGLTGDEPEQLIHDHNNPPLTQSNRELGDPRIFSLGNNALSIVGEGGEIVVNGSNVTNTIEGAQPWLKFGGQEQTINQFILPNGNYEIITTESEDDSYFGGGLIDGENIIMFHRHGANLADEDKLMLDGTELSYVNETGTATEILAEVITQVDGDEFHFEINELSLDTDQSVSLEFINEGLYISNNGSNTNYNVVLEIFEEGGVMQTTEVSGIPIAEGITQIIIPRFVDGMLDGVIVTDSDGDPGTEDPETEYGNMGLPLMIVSTDSLLITNDAQSIEIGVGNIGSGILNWSVLSSPSWVQVVSGAPGTNYGIIEFNVDQNTLESREGNIVVQNDNADADIRTIYIQQNDLNNSIENLGEDDLVLMPNPVSRTLRVEIPNLLKGKNPRYTITTIEGKIVLTGNCQSDVLELNLSQLNPGMYLFQLEDGELKYIKRVLRINE